TMGIEAGKVLRLDEMARSDNVVFSATGITKGDLLDGITRWTQVATSGVILFGIALVFTFNALVSMLQFIANEDTLQGLVFWTMGSIDRASWSKVAILLVALALVMPL
ncbi:iron chelate uptake ABC transporter family permease subunit, partial [Pseudomonas aeruginosa]|nr:iron chelate uptake ABC transporter family permease subunit [Pseudomonas aeruginosa]